MLLWFYLFLTFRSFMKKKSKIRHLFVIMFYFNCSMHNKYQNVITKFLEKSNKSLVFFSIESEHL
jgi:hypothetical protein